jgi:hypothetical protein
MHANMNGIVRYAPRPERGSMDFSYEVVRLGERPAEELAAGDPGVAPLAILGRLPEGLSLEDGLTAVAHRLGDRLAQVVPPEQAKRLLLDALLLTGLRVRRDVAVKVFGGIRMMEESDTYLMILDQGQEKRAKKDILLVGEKRFGAPDESVKAQLDAITDLDRLDRMLLKSITTASWKEILDTP